MKLDVIEKLKNCIRVIRLNKMPTKEKFFETFRICIIGVFVLGLIGFLFYIISVIFGL